MWIRSIEFEREIKQKTGVERVYRWKILHQIFSLNSLHNFCTKLFEYSKRQMPMENCLEKLDEFNLQTLKIKCRIYFVSFHY